MDELRPYCRAHSKRTGKPCRNRILPGEKVCRMHGRDGGAPLIHGKDSNLPERIRQAKIAATNDPRLLDLADGVALMDGLMQSRMAMLAAGDSAAWRRDLLAKLEEWRAAEDEDRHAAHGELEALIEDGARASQAEDELFEMRERLSARVEEVHRIRLARGSVINARDLAKLQVMQFREMQRVMALRGVPLAVQQEVVKGLLDMATRSDVAPNDFRAELEASALEVAGGRI